MDQAIVPSWDLFITLLVIIIVAYGVVMARERILVTLVSAYVGMVVANVWGSTIYDFFNGNRTILNKVWIRSSASLFFVQLIIFGLVIGVLSFRSGLTAKGGKGLSTLEHAAYSIMTAALVISSLISFMPQAQQVSVIQSSRIAHLIMTHQTWWVVLPLLLMVVTAGSKRGSSPTNGD